MKIKENISLITKPIVVFIIGFAVIFITSASSPAFMGTAICLTIGTVFILVADAIKKFSNISKENCTYSTLGVISGYSKPDSDSAAFPVYTYQYGGNEYTVRSNVSSSFRNPAVGEEVDIFLNPDNPEDSYLEVLTRSTDIICKIFKYTGIVLVITAFAIALIICAITII